MSWTDNDRRFLRVMFALPEPGEETRRETRRVSSPDPGTPAPAAPPALDWREAAITGTARELLQRQGRAA